MKISFTIEVRHLLLLALFCVAGCAIQTRPGASSQTPLTNPGIEVRVSDDMSDAAEPAVGSDSTGTVYVVFVEHGKDKNSDLYLQKYDSDLKSSGERVRVNAEAGDVKSWRGDPPTIVIGSDGAIFVGWTRTNKNGGTDLVISSSRDSGSTFSAPTKINDDEAPASHGMHSLAVSGDGTIYAAWLDERNVRSEQAAAMPQHGGFEIIKIDHKGTESTDAPEPNSEVFFATSTDGGKKFSKNLLVAHDVCPCCKTAVVAAKDGRVFVSWRQVLEGDYRHIAVAASNDGGKTFAPRSIVSDDQWQLNACPVSGAAMYASTGNDLETVWYTAGDAGQAGYYAASSQNAAAKFTARSLITNEAASGSPVLLGSGSRSTLVVPGSDNRVLLMTKPDRGSEFRMESVIESASNPSAAIANGSTVIVFVRSNHDNRSVWLTKR